MVKNKRLIINPERCKVCGICVEFCPPKALTLNGGIALIESIRCKLCGLCELRCPDYALHIEVEEEHHA